VFQEIKKLIKKTFVKRT